MKNFFLVWPLLFMCVYASSLVESYRDGGLDALELKIEEILQKPSYWNVYLRDKDVSKGFYEFSSPIIFVDKKAQTMRLIRNVNGKQEVKTTQDVITGKMGDKYKEGDLKTPVGVYEVVRRFVPKDAYYGPLAFELSYPNLMDELKGKNGHGIWIHGYPLDNAQRPSQTKGCVALENDLLLDFDQKLNSTGAIVIISEAGDINADKEDIAMLLSDIYKWRYAWKVSDVDAYLSFYDDSFVRFDGKNKRQFSAMKRQIFKKKEKKIIRFTNIGITPYPDAKNGSIYRIVFNEYYKSKNYTFNGKKEIYAKLENGKMKILVEK